MPVSRSKVQRSRSPGPLMLTHPAAYHPMPTYHIPLDVVVRRISRPFPYQFAPNSHAVFQWGTATLQLWQIFEYRFLNLDLFPSKNRYLTVSAVSKQQHCCYSDRSTAVTSRPIHWRPRPIAHESPTHCRSITNIHTTRATLRTSFKVKVQGHKLASSVASSLPLLNSGNKMLYLCH